MYKTDNAVVKVGKFYASQQNFVYLGVEVEIGSEGRQTVLCPVDTSKLKKEFKFEYVNKED